MFTSGNFSGEHLEDVWENGHHTRHWIDANGLDNGEAVYVPSHAEFQERTALRKLLTKKLKLLSNMKFSNAKSGINANFSVRSINKLGSDKAVNKSVINGFSAAEHFEAAMKIKSLYESADFVGRFLDDRNDPNVVAMYRFQTPLLLSSGKSSYAYITTKEVKIQGNRTYTIELLATPYPKK